MKKPPLHPVAFRVECLGCRQPILLAKNGKWRRTDVADPLPDSRYRCRVCATVTIVDETTGEVLRISERNEGNQK